MADPILTPARMADWLTVLDRIDTSISRALDETGAYERALAAEPPRGREADPDVDRHLRGLRSHLEAAGMLAEAVEGLLASDEGEIRAWMSLANRARVRLAAPAGGSIS
jgi:hypothetical protein